LAGGLYCWNQGPAKRTRTDGLLNAVDQGRQGSADPHLGDSGRVALRRGKHAAGSIEYVIARASGNLTDSYAGQTTPCDWSTGGTHVQNKYQGDSGVSCGAKTGELCSTIDGNGNTTSYGYDSNGNVTSVTPPRKALETPSD